MLWYCWFGVRKNIQPVKELSDEVLVWLSVWHEVQMICKWYSWCHCHCHSIISCFIKIQNGFFWCRLIQVVLEKEDAKRVSVCLFTVILLYKLMDMYLLTSDTWNVVVVCHGMPGCRGLWNKESISTAEFEISPGPWDWRSYQVHAHLKGI